MNCKELTRREHEIMRCFADNGMRVTPVAEAMHYHQNTVSYYLKRIYEKTGLNPRSFYDLAKLMGEDVGSHTPCRGRKAVYQSAIDTFGADLQRRKAEEELVELMVELFHYPDGKSTREALIDELADATIMLEQLRLIFDADEEVAARIDYKVNRLSQKLDEKGAR